MDALNWTFHLALANLLCASLREDPYGVAQGDITKVLEAFVLYLMELEKLTKTLIASVEGDEKSLERVEMLKEIEVEIESVENGEWLRSLRSSQLMVSDCSRNIFSAQGWCENNRG